ncbi:MAG: glycerol-3-phosphate acyltransferase [Dehalococcoidales bacterium]|nr:glycerol-3-phosphate acyltransferase [Dehalococcoidales bacterium]
MLVLGAYLLGSIPSAYLIARWTRGIDIRQYGSGNVGASNISAVVSKWWTVPVTIFDLGKGMLVVYLARLVGLELYQQILVGIAAIVGHNWPVFLHFSGGRGILTTVGVILVLSPWLTLSMVGVALLFFAPLHQLPIVALLVFSAAPFCIWFLAPTFHIERSLTLVLGFVAVLLLIIIRRLAVSRTQLSASVPTKELIVNRLLFDRDIKDRKAWTERSPLKTNSMEKPLDLPPRK